MKRIASLSLDLDNKWSYLQTHGDERWREFGTYLPTLVPRVLDFLKQRDIKITFFIVGRDATIDANVPHLKAIAQDGHEVACHSLKHEPWLHFYSRNEIDQELADAEQAIESATGVKPKGFRGPGYSISSDLLRVLHARGYGYDCTSFPNILNPLARAYFFKRSKLSDEEKEKRGAIFGTSKEALRPLKPYEWDIKDAGIGSYLPVTQSSPMKLMWRLLKTGDRRAYYAMYMAGLGIGMTPLDWLMSVFETKSLHRAPDIERPVVVVVGAPRSGTSLTARVLLNSIDFSYLDNLTQLFPRSPITAQRWFGRFLPKRTSGYETYYGKSNRLAGFNDGLYVWDRWLGADRASVPTTLVDGSAAAIKQFFGKMQSQSGLPTLCKVNRVNTCAALVGEVSKQFYFICLRRNPVNLAQSLLKARKDITGDLLTPYGVRHRASSSSVSDIVNDVCDQVRFHEQHQLEQQAKLGEDRFWIVDYEEFCADPMHLVSRVSQEILGFPVPTMELPQFKVSDSLKVTEREYAQIRANFIT